MRTKSLWPWLIAIFIVGWLMFGWVFIVFLIICILYLKSNSARMQSAKQAINNGSWPDLTGALTRKYINTSRSYFSSIPHFTMSKKHLFRFSLITFICTAVVMIIMDGFVSVPAGHVGVIYDRGRGILENELDEGLHLKIPYWQTVILMDTRLQTYTMSTNLSEADLINNTVARQAQGLIGKSNSVIREFAEDTDSSNSSIDALTKDGQRIKVDLTAQFRIDGKNASIIYQTIGINYVDKVVRPAARSITREKVTGFTTKELYSEDTRQQLELVIEAAMKDNYSQKNVILEDILIRDIGFSDSYLNAIEEKQIAQQKIEKADFEKQEAEIIKQKTIIEAEAEAEAISLKGEALKKNPEVIQLQFVEKMSPGVKWGILPDGALPLLNMDDLTKQ